MKTVDYDALFQVWAKKFIFDFDVHQSILRSQQFDES